MTIEVAEKKWEEFCTRVEEACRGAMVNIQLEHPDGATHTVAQSVPLLSVAIDDKSDPCNTNLVIDAGQPGKNQVTHVVVEPIHIRLEHGHTSGRYHRLHIMAENGITVVEFHPGLSPDVFEGLKLGRP